MRNASIVSVLVLAFAGPGQARSEALEPAGRMVEEAPLARPQDAESAGQAAEEAGRLREALQDYLAALQALPDPPSSEVDQRLRERIIRVVLRLGTPPPLPDEAQRHFRRAREVLEAQAELGNPDDPAALQAAATEFRKAVQLAPWWPEAIFALAAAQQKLQRYDEAIANLKLYRLAAPDARSGAGVVTIEGKRDKDDKVEAHGPSVVYVYLANNKTGWGGPLYCDNEKVARMEKRRFVVLRPAPGTHRIRFDSDRDQARTTVSAQFGADREYYIRASYEGSFRPHPVARLTTKDEARAEMRDQKMRAADGDKVYDSECKAPGAASK